MTTPVVSSVPDLPAVIAQRRLVPVIQLGEPELAVGLGEALVAGGLPVAEVTLRSPGALAVLERMAQVSSLCVGAGTVLTSEQVRQVHDAGAAFVVSPGLDRDVVEAALGLGMPVVPGVVTPSEVQAAMRLGLRCLKFFPAGTFGGAAALRALAGPFPDATFIPTGGVSAATCGDYLAEPCVVAVGGSWMVPPAAVNEGRFDAVRGLVAEAVDLVGGLR